MSGRRQRNWRNKIALERMQILFNQAESEFSKHPERSDRYVKLTRKISSRYQLPLPDYWRGRFCKNCNKFLKVGVNLRVRLSKDKRISYKCLECGNSWKDYYNKKD
ncbi:ribonuclease P protein component 4 [Methanosphaera cuniculi]|uniref:Ribonuclease P protein component 4 n=1 Tax=Methanosphaera cuniculi TaxID=1077256 RepID=A0A2A2HF16_9EURY|nr:ribonuclease P [Methanosphaera cuniculi]PAV08022.1 ribonuclease P [Methanosphaera cuniculi]PWL08753.1 ribonuclease P protein component 4 [Methanosphaera cuniculi]